MNEDKYTRASRTQKLLYEKSKSDRPGVFKAVLPLPVSANDLHTVRRRGGVMLTAAARAYYARMAAILPGLWPFEPWAEERLRLEYTLYESDMRKRDVSNYVKSLQDAMEGFVYVNDSQIDEVLCLRGQLRETPEVLVVVSVIKNPLIREPLSKVRRRKKKEDVKTANQNAKIKAMRVAGLTQY